MRISEAMQDHLDGGHTTLAHAWAITRRDGRVLGFTDHDLPLHFEGIDFRPDTGMSAMAVQRATGLSVDNTEALGALSDAAIREADIEAGRYDDAEVRVWRVNWADVAERALMFRGLIGELKRVDGAFHAEVRGLSSLLNRPVGRVYQKPCTAVLGDGNCGFDVATPGYVFEGVIVGVEEGRSFDLGPLEAFEPDWFTRGRLELTSGAGEGLTGAIKAERFTGGARRIELWEPIRAAIAAGDGVRLVAGCDKRFETCRLKFNNAVNYQGFPDLPSDDWVMIGPGQTGETGGGSRR